MQKKLLQLSLVSALLTGMLGANEIQLKALKVTSTAIQTDELESTDAVEIYTAKDIEAAHVQNIYDFLNKETSVTALTNYGNPFTQKLDMHGYGITNGYQNIVVKVNGRRLNNVDLTPQLLTSISINAVERIEIIKSGGIVEGGDGANAGVINIITKPTNKTEVGVSSGTYNSFDGTFYVGHTDKKMAYNITGEAQKNGGIRYVDDNGGKDKNKFSNFSFDFAYNVLQELKLSLHGLTSYSDVWYASSLTQNQYEEDPTQKSSSYYAATHQQFTSDVAGAGFVYDINDELALKGEYNHEYKTSNYITYFNENKYIYNSGKVFFDYEDETLALVAGVEIFDGDRRSAALFGNPANITSKKNTAAFSAVKYKYKDSTLKAGYRYEKVSYKYTPQAGTVLTQDDVLHGIELGYNYKISKKQSVYANYAKGYQSPDIDRFFDYGGVFNQFIKPMKTHSFTLGYNRFSDENKFKISAYYVNLRDEIYYYADPTYINSKNTNIDRSHKYGVDIYDKYMFNKELALTLNYNYVDAVIDKEKQNGDDYAGKNLPGVSKHSVKAVLDYKPNKKVTYSLTEVYRSEAYAANDFNNNFAQKQDAYITTDISVTYAQKGWETFAKVNNLFNQKNGLWIQDDAIYPVNFTTTAVVGLKLKY